MIRPVTGTELRFRLERLGLSPEQFADEAGISNITIRNHEAGKIAAPRRSTAFKIGSALERLETQMEATKENPRWTP
jgi:predicted transcriptional regulator